MTRQRFLHVFGTFDHGGAEDRTVRLINQFSDLARHAVWVGIPSAMGAAAAIDPSLGVAFPPEGAALVLGRPSLARYRQIAMALTSFDLILTYSWGAMDVVMAHWLFARRLKLPPLIHHDDGFDSKGPSRTQNLFRRIAMRTCYAHVVPSQVLVDYARSRWRVRQSRIRQIANGIALQFYVNAPGAPYFPGLARKAGEVVIGSIAGLRGVKNLPRLVRAVAAAGPGLRLAIAGEGPDRARIAAEAERLGFTDRLHMPGFLPAAASYIRAFDVFALSSDSEQAPISMIEAMAAGLPVVAPDVGDIRGMVAKENLPYIAPAGDEMALARALAALAADPALREAIGAANAAKALAQFDDQQMFAAFRTLYSEAVDSFSTQ